MRKVRLFALFTLLASNISACAHVIGYDRQAQTVSIQVGKWAGESTAHETAEEYCGGHATLLGMQQAVVGSHTSEDAHVRGNRVFGTSDTRVVNRNVYAYSCR